MWFGSLSWLHWWPLLALHLGQREEGVLLIPFLSYHMTSNTRVLTTLGGDIASARTFRRLPRQANPMVCFRLFL